MNNTITVVIAIALIAVIISVTNFVINRPAGAEKVSCPGNYKGYSEAVFDGNVRRSSHLTLSNGIRLAYDLILPAKKGVATDKPMPVLFKYTPYLRTFTIFDQDGKNIIADLFKLSWMEKVMLSIRYRIYDRGNLMDPVFRTKWLDNMIKHGYAVIVVERPGTGASFGVLNPSFSSGAAEADEILNWIAAQPWCDGNIGMFGDSWQGQIQLAVAAKGNKYLKAIMPVSSSLDNYGAVVYPGGVYNKAFGSFFSWSTSFLESDVVTPVDEDNDGVLLAQARSERNRSTLGEKSAAVMTMFPFRDCKGIDGSNIWIDYFALYPFIDDINRAGVPVYMVTGWFDLFTDDMLVSYANLTVPKKMLVRPLDHSQLDSNQFDLDYHAEVQRWFDYWLKGIDNGIMSEPPVNYYLMSNGEKGSWQNSTGWPLKATRASFYYFDTGRTGTVDSVNDGFLRTDMPVKPDSYDTCRADYTCSSGTRSRWNAINWSGDYPDMRRNDSKGLTYTTPPMEKPMILTGHPVVHAWFVCDAGDPDFFAYLEAVDCQGRSTYITEGNLRASQRALCQAPFDNLGLPYHSFYAGDVEPVTAGKPFELVFDMQPTAYRLDEGERLRISITFADSDNFDVPELNSPPTMKLLNNSSHLSYLILPVEQ
jgi:uncharacterized protein